MAKHTHDSTNHHKIGIRFQQKPISPKWHSRYKMRERDRKTASRFVFIRLIMRCCETVPLFLLKMGLKTVGSRWLHTFSMRICSLDLKTEKEHRIYVYRLWPVNMHLFNVTKNLFEHLEAVFPLPIHAFFVRSMAASLFFFLLISLETFRYSLCAITATVRVSTRKITKWRANIRNK